MASAAVGAYASLRLASRVNRMADSASDYKPAVAQAGEGLAQAGSGLKRLADTAQAYKPAVAQAGQGLAAVGRSTATCTAVATRPVLWNLWPWRV